VNRSRTIALAAAAATCLALAAPPATASQPVPRSATVTAFQEDVTGNQFIANGTARELMAGAGPGRSQVALACTPVHIVNADTVFTSWTYATCFLRDTRTSKVYGVEFPQTWGPVGTSHEVVEVPRSSTYVFCTLIVFRNHPALPEVCVPFE
jgi:hypothetical protein